MTRTMIVDDEEDLRVLVKAVIARADEGLSVACEAADGEAAIEQWRECRPDVVLLDQRMPRLSGLEVAERMLAEKPDQAIILFSAFLDEAIRSRARELGVRECLSKDDIDDLPRALWAVGA